MEIGEEKCKNTSQLEKHNIVLLGSNDNILLLSIITMNKNNIAIAPT
jgi:hypothetical protein